MTEKRKHSRIDSIYLYNYIHIDANDSDSQMQGMGRTINVSESGIMLETHTPFGENDTVDVVVGLKEDMVTLRGRVVFTQTTETGQFRSGIDFLSIDDDSLTLLRRYIKAFNALSTNDES